MFPSHPIPWNKRSIPHLTRQVWLRLLPTVISVPLLVGCLCLAGQIAGYYSAIVTIELSIIATIVSLVVWVISTGVQLQRLVEQQYVIQDALRESEARYETLFDAIGEGLVFQNATGEILMANPAAEQILGLTADQLAGRTSIDPRWQAVYEDGRPFPGDQHPAMITLQTGKPCCDVVMGIQKPNQDLAWLLVNSQPLMREGAAGPYGVVASFIDITERRIHDQITQASLAEKEVLLNEIHHRVKNNLQVVASLLKFQAAAFSDPEVAAAFQESQNRVRSMVLVHEALYRSTNLAQIDIAHYLKSLIHHLSQVYGAATRGIDIRLNVTIASMDVTVATPCGLIVNELVSNALKHAFASDKGGRISVDLIPHAGKHLLVIMDTGTGMPDTIDISQTQSLGLQLVWSLTNQLEGEIMLTTDPNTTFTILF
jgi:PAS domain S-box-containing protein